MTLVLPYCSEQTENRLFFEPLRSKMPCVYDGEPMDFESAFMSGEWPTLKDIASEYEQSEDSTKATSGSGDRSPSKRKLNAEATSNESGVTEAKKPCPDSYLTHSPFAEVSNGSPSSTPSPLGCTAQESSAAEDEDEAYTPRRRGPQMWNSRQRWKDERKKVLKMSVAKLAEIEDPELWLLRSVLINNTIKRLHNDIRNERQAKIRHRQQKMDFFHDRYEPPVVSSSAFSPPSVKPQSSSPAPSDMYDDTSCDEIFGISEDFLRVTIPDRRMSSSPIPTALVQDISREDKAVDQPSSSSDCDTARCDQQQQQPQPSHSSPIAFTTRTTHTNSLGSTPQQRLVNGGTQCATQFRTNEGSGICCGGDATFPPRVPILDSVVYHSLLASLESS